MMREFQEKRNFHYMSAKEKIIEHLNKCKGTYISGEELAKAIGISRAGIWKNIKLLQKEGYLIDAVTNKGYRLNADNDIPNEELIRSYLTIPSDAVSFKFFEETMSTNSVAYSMALEGHSEGLVVLSKKQSRGRGHLGHEFYSPEGSGIYLSLLLRPSNITQQDTGFITCISAVSMCKSLIKVSGKEIGIKWANDLFLEDKKICGILTEGSLDLESGILSFCITGCGVNLYPPKGGFPSNLSDIAGTLFKSPVDDAGSKVIANYLNFFYDYYNEFQKGKNMSFIDDYRNYSLVIGKNILVEIGNESKKAHVTSIDDNCRLVIKCENNQEIRLEPGMGSIKDIYT